MKTNIEKIIKDIVGIKDDKIESKIIKYGFLWEYELDNYVLYKGKDIKILYDVVNKCIVGYKEIE